MLQHILSQMKIKHGSYEFGIINIMVNKKHLYGQINLIEKGTREKQKKKGYLNCDIFKMKKRNNKNIFISGV